MHDITSIKSTNLFNSISSLKTKEEKKTWKKAPCTHTIRAGTMNAIAGSKVWLTIRNEENERSEKKSHYFHLKRAIDDSIRMAKIVFSPLVCVPLVSSTNLCLPNRIMCHTVIIVFLFGCWNFGQMPIECYGKYICAVAVTLTHKWHST